MNRCQQGYLSAPPRGKTSSPLIASQHHPEAVVVHLKDIRNTVAVYVGSASAGQFLGIRYAVPVRIIRAQRDDGGEASSVGPGALSESKNRARQ